jgi:hypothetical protein
MLLDEERETELELLVARLDRLVPRDGARLALPEGSAGAAAVGNRLGYLRFGIELLRAALRPLPQSEAEPARIAPDLGYFVAEGPRAAFEACEIDESIVSRDPAASRLGALGQMGSGVLAVIALLLALLGVSVVWRWIFG